MDSLKSSIVNLGTSILNGIKDLLTFLFVPSDNIFGELETMFNNKFGIFNQIIELGRSIAFIDDTVKPKFTITLYGESVEFINFSMFDNYRVYIHNITVFLAYFGFFIWLLKNAPGIIGGIGGSLQQRGNVS